MRRISVVGNAGAGKTTLARRLAAALEVRHVELDAIFHQPGWTELPTDELRRRVGAELATDGWVVDGTDNAVRDLVWAAADTVVWFGRPRPIVMRRLVLRTARRAVTREALWNGNREPVLAMFRRNDENLVRWAWQHHGDLAERYAAAAADPTDDHLTFVRVASDLDVDRLLASAGRAGA